MRRRRTQAVAPTVGETEPLDEHDQEEAVAALKHEGMQQIETTNRIFTFVCILAMSMTFVAVLHHQGSAMREWIHAAYSSGVHWLARSHGTTIPTQEFQSFPSQNSVALLIFLVTSPLLIIAVSVYTSLNEADDAMLHWSLALANLFVMICSILLRNESINTLKFLEILEASKYSYKSI
jgi:magnesium-transporting ATPase (P-type)